MKTPTVILMLFCTSITVLASNESPDPLDREIPGCLQPKLSLDEAVHKIEMVTGFQVTYPAGLQEFIEVFGNNVHHFSYPTQDTKYTARKLLDIICRNYALTSQSIPLEKTLALDFPWKTSDPRSQKELVHFLYHPGGENDCKTNPKWLAAFNALISKPRNIGKAWRVRQLTQYGCISFLNKLNKINVGGNPLLTKLVTMATGKRVIFALVCQPIEFFPGNGSVSYYWFDEEGVLLGAGLMNTGHRRILKDVIIDNEYTGTDKPSVITMNTDCFTARFVLRDDGLKLKHIAGANGESIDNLGYNIGEDLMAPQHTADDFSAQYSFLKINFDTITPEFDDAGLVTGLNASVHIVYTSSMRLVSSSQRDGFSATFENEHGEEQEVTFQFEKLTIPQTLIEKYKLKPGYRIWPKNSISLDKDTNRTKS